MKYLRCSNPDCQNKVKVPMDAKVGYCSRGCRSQFSPKMAEICVEYGKPVTKDGLKSVFEDLRKFHGWGEISVILGVTPRTAKVWREKVGVGNEKISE